MALSQVYTAVTGDTITAARWNNEFGNIYSNGTDVAFPTTKNVSFAGFTVTMDAANATTMVSTAASGLVYTPGAKSGTPGTNANNFNMAASTFTDSATAGGGTATMWNSFGLRQPTLNATNAAVTTTKASTLYIEDAPTTSNETLTNAYALYVDAGKVQLDGALQVEGAVTFNGAVVVASANNDGLAPYQLLNLGLSVSMSGSAVTISVLTDTGGTPSSTSPVRVRFRNATLATYGTTNVNITGALTMQISSGSTLGTVSAQASRIYIGLLNNAGTAELFAYNPLSGSSLKRFSESQLITTTAEGGAGGADSAQTAYSTTARTSVAFRIIGFFESTQATAGTWNTAASTIQELQPWMPRTGDVVGTAYGSDGTFVQNTSTIPNDDTIPQSSEGSQIISVSYTPVSAVNVIELDGHIAHIGITATATFALFSTVSANALVSNHSTVTASFGARIFTRSATIGTLTSASLRAGTSDGSTFNVNGDSAATDMAATMNTYLRITEIMV